MLLSRKQLWRQRRWRALSHCCWLPSPLPLGCPCRQLMMALHLFACHCYLPCHHLLTPHHRHCSYLFAAVLRQFSWAASAGREGSHPPSFIIAVLVIFVVVKGIMGINALPLMHCPTVAMAAAIAIIILVVDSTSLRPCPPCGIFFCRWILPTNMTTTMGLPLGPGGWNNSYQTWLNSPPIHPGNLLRLRGNEGGILPCENRLLNFVDKHHNKELRPLSLK